MSRKLDGDVEVPKNQMTTLCGIKLAKAQVLEILVRNGTGIRTEVGCHGAKSGVLEWSSKPQVPLLQLSQPCFANRMQVGGVGGENS